MKKFIKLIIFIVLINIMFFSPVLAAKPRIRPAGTSGTGGGIAIATAKLRSDRLALFVNFINLNQLTSVSYSLTYTGNGVDQGYQGSISTAGQISTSRELVFGTCSSGVCRYYSNIKNMHLVITGQTITGKTVIKKFLVKV